MVNKSILGATCACLAVVSFNVNAALIGVLPATPGGTDFQAYYDDQANLTWLADANVIGATRDLNINGVYGWIMPRATHRDMESLYYGALGNSLGALENTGPFINVVSGYYWTGEARQRCDIGVTDKWCHYETAFNFGDGSVLKEYQIQETPLYRWPIRVGDVREFVPIPSAVWLFGSGLIGLIGVARRKVRA